MPCARLRRLLPLEHGAVLFQLLLPMARLTAAEVEELRPLLLEHFAGMGVPRPARPALAECLLSGLMAD